jgi:hypothetical protein
MYARRWPLFVGIGVVFSDAPFEVLNLVSGVVYALAMPFVALMTAYIYFDALGRDRLEPGGEAGRSSFGAA